MPNYSAADLKILFARSGGLCAFPECTEEIICRGTNDVLGQIAHIVARSDGGPRSDPMMSAEARNSFENLLLLYRNHHAQIDSPAGAREWTAQALREMKKQHEQWVGERLVVWCWCGPLWQQLRHSNLVRCNHFWCLCSWRLHLERTG